MVDGLMLLRAAAISGSLTVGGVGGGSGFSAEQGGELGTSPRKKAQMMIEAERERP